MQHALAMFEEAVAPEKWRMDTPLFGATPADAEGLAASILNMRELEAVLEGQDTRRAELQEYMSRLQQQTGEDGSKLVELPRSYAVMVEEMIRQQRGEHECLQGWLGPRRCLHMLPHCDLALAYCELLPECITDPMTPLVF
jgi:hypothetical protein